MNLWLTHFGILFIGSGALMIGIASLTSGGFPIWLFLIWVIGSLAASGPSTERSGAPGLVRSGGGSNRTVLDLPRSRCKCRSLSG